jgi:Haem-binding domain
VKKTLLAALAVFAVIQFVPAAPPKTNPPSDPAKGFAQVMKPPPAIVAILKRACYDCHSHDTVWPWYADIAPVSWLVRDHVVDGRKHLNFSEWLRGTETEFSDWSAVEEICKRVEDATMPMPGYVWLHPEAALAEADKKAICAWVDGALAGSRR